MKSKWYRFGEPTPHIDVLSRGGRLLKIAQNVCPNEYMLDEVRNIILEIVKSYSFKDEDMYKELINSMKYEDGVGTYHINCDKKIRYATRNKLDAIVKVIYIRS